MAQVVPQVKDIYYKLFEIQSEFTEVKKNAANPFYNSKYADLNSLIKALRPILKEYDLLLLQYPEVVDGLSVMTTRLIDVHTSQDIKSSIEFPKVTDPQKVGSAITYFQRFCIKALFLLEAVDDDGETAAGRGAVELQEKKEKWKEQIAKIDTVQGLADFHKKNKENEKHILTMLGKRRKEIETTTL